MPAFGSPVAASPGFGMIDFVGVGEVVEDFEAEAEDEFSGTPD